MFKASVLGALTWRVVEEVDDALLRSVEEGSGHGVVLSISTEKLKRQDKKEIEVAGKAGGHVPVKRQLWARRTPMHPWISSSACTGRHQLQGPVSQTLQDLVSLLSPPGSGCPHPECCSAACPTCKGYATELPWMGWQSLEQ